MSEKLDQQKRDIEMWEKFDPGPDMGWKAFESDFLTGAIGGAANTLGSSITMSPVIQSLQKLLNNSNNTNAAGLAQGTSTTGGNNYSSVPGYY